MLCGPSFFYRKLGFVFHGGRWGVFMHTLIDVQVNEATVRNILGILEDALDEADADLAGLTACTKPPKRQEERGAAFVTAVRLAMSAWRSCGSNVNEGMLAHIDSAVRAIHLIQRNLPLHHQGMSDSETLARLAEISRVQVCLAGVKEMLLDQMADEPVAH